MTSSGERDTVGLSAPGLLHGIRPCALQHAYPVAGPWRRVVVLPHASHHDALFVAGRRRSPSTRAGLADACICAGDAPSQSEERHRAEKAWSAMLPVPKRAIPRESSRSPSLRLGVCSGDGSLSRMAETRMPKIPQRRTAHGASSPERVCRKVLAASWVSSATLSHARDLRCSTASHSRQKAVRGFLGGVVSRKNPQKCTYFSGKKGR